MAKVECLYTRKYLIISYKEPPIPTGTRPIILPRNTIKTSKKTRKVKEYLIKLGTGRLGALKKAIIVIIIPIILT